VIEGLLKGEAKRRDSIGQQSQLMSSMRAYRQTLDA
jgi:hypothetical protein